MCVCVYASRVLSLGQKVLVLILVSQAAGRISSRVPITKSLVSNLLLFNPQPQFLSVYATCAGTLNTVFEAPGNQMKAQRYCLGQTGGVEVLPASVT